MGSRPGPIEQMTQGPGEHRRVPSAHVDATVAQLKLARRLLDECNGDYQYALTVLRALSDG